MITLPKALRAWGSSTFATTLKAELESLEARDLPLDKAATPGSYVDDSPVCVSILQTAEDTTGLHARVGVFFTEIIINCGCGDDPYPQNAYCELRIVIDKATAESVFSVVRE